MHENCTNENGDLVYLMLTNLYNGSCILPSAHFFEDELFEHLGVEGDVVTEASKIFLRGQTKSRWKSMLKKKVASFGDVAYAILTYSKMLNNLHTTILFIFHLHFFN